MVYSFYKKQRILYLHRKGFRPPTIQKILEKEGLTSTRIGIYKLLERFKNTGCITSQPGSGCPSKVTDEIKQIVEEQMSLDDETTTHQLHCILTSKGYNLSIDTILRCRSSLGWTFRGSAYCQLIRDVNKVKRYEWAVQYKDDEFDDVVFTDECTVQLEAHRRFCCRKKGETPRPKPRYIVLNIYIYNIIYNIYNYIIISYYNYYSMIVTL